MVRNLLIQKKEIKNGLYIISTPIGNLEDITLRAINILKKSDYVLCEDTRVSKVLLKKYEINTKLISNHKFNEKKNLSKTMNLLKSGSIISLISDAGTPIIADPGAILVQECISNDINIIPIPGPSSVVSAIANEELITMVDFRITYTLDTGEVRKLRLPGDGTSLNYYP